MSCTKAELAQYEQKCHEQWRAVSRCVWPMEDEDDEKAQEKYRKMVKGRLYEALLERGSTQDDCAMIDAVDAFCAALCRRDHASLANAMHTIACGRWPALSVDEWDQLCTLASPKHLGGIFDNKYHSRDVMADFFLFLTVHVMGGGDPVAVDISEGDTGYDTLVLGTKVDDTNPWRPVLQGSYLEPNRVPVKLYLATNLSSFVYEFETESALIRYAIPFGEVVAPGPDKKKSQLAQEEQERIATKQARVADSEEREVILQADE